MAFSESQLTALEAAIAKGMTSVQFGERRVTYQSLTDMIKLRDVMRTELGVSLPTAAKSRIVNIATGKGL
jgi:hypothetical protein